ncbi:PRC-barrel domain-containing protein [Salegentibacter sp. Hel_I_6]|uniref:PRC-barrel domain-containing protein n=1 Tax=Salegentibacter sp. Hel_I_6 TaxID=1250278 RepID=UPI0012E04783|nr:PRC-barrel domain-containing protein [Salegentibacter sp. Hel_I_6]
MSKQNIKNKNLHYLSELKDYKVASGYPDIRGWTVRDADKRVVGKVDNLLINKNLDRVVYVDVEVDQTIIDSRHDPYGKPADPEIKEFVNKDGQNHVIVPIGLIELEEDEKYIFTSRITHQTFAETKRIERGADLDRKYEENVLSSYNRPSRITTDDEHIKRRKEEEYADKTISGHGDDEQIIDDNYEAQINKDRHADDSFYEREEFDGANFRKRD